MAAMKRDTVLQQAPAKRDMMQLDDIPIVVERPVSPFQRLCRNTAARKVFLVVLFFAIWQVYGIALDNTLLFPSLSNTLAAMARGIIGGDLLASTGNSLRLLLIGYAIAIAVAVVISGLAMTSALASEALVVLTSMLNPLPSIALLPMAMMWFGLGDESVIFIMVYSVVWPLTLSIHSGFLSVPPTLRMVGRNCGLSSVRYVAQILVPAAFPSILSGLKIGWAFAWRALIAAELVFGVTSGGGGLGWFIFENKNQLDIPSVFAGLLVVILIGLFVENVIFKTIENRTVRRWGMHV